MRFPGALACLLLLSGFTSPSALAQPPVRLKGRTFVPPANVHAGRRAVGPAARGFAVAALGERTHLLVQFAGRVTAKELAALRSAGAQPLRYVPDNTVAVAAGPGFDPASVPGVRWSGPLEPGDRLSAETAGDLGRDFPSFPLTVVEFHPDLTAGRVRERLEAAGTAAVAVRGLPPYMTAIPTEPAAIGRLASDEAVAWIYPATADLAGGTLLCEGLAGPQGIVANYATVGEGWDGGGRGAVSLSYFFQTGSVDLQAPAQHQEVERALGEWARYVELRWRPAGQPREPASVTVLWGPREHGDGYPFAPEVLAHAFFPSPPGSEPWAGDIHFNDAYTWGVGDPNRYDIYSVALHEAGHSLGLGHASDPLSVMYPIYQGIVTGLAELDIAAIRSLYASREALPAGWRDRVVGGDDRGGATEAQGIYTVTAGGRDVWGTADELRFASRPLSGDGDITARLDSLEAAHRWTKAGLMIRESADPSSPHAFVLVSGGRGLAFQRRTAAGAATVSSDAGPGTAPRWLWLKRRGSRISAYVAAEGGPWRPAGTDTFTMSPDVLVGLAMVSHSELEASAVFSHVSLVPGSAWTHADVGAVGAAGWLRATADGVRIAGAGADIWGTADAFHFAWVPLTGDGEITARVAAFSPLRAWSKAGVMLRESLEPGSPHAFMLISGGRGYAFQSRARLNDVSASSAAGEGTAPGWVRLQRRGQVITAFRSDDGVTWTRAGSATIAMGTRVLAGLAVSSHVPTAASQALFDRVSVR